MTIKKLSRMPYAQAHVEIHDGTISLFSYVTLVADIDKDGWLTVYGLYSQTTRIYNDGYKFNIHTGEVVEIGD